MVCYSGISLVNHGVKEMEYLIVRNPETVRNFDIISADFSNDEYTYVHRNLPYDEAVDILEIVKMGEELKGE